MTTPGMRVPPALLALIGAGAGVLSGLFGIGGGVVMVPALVMAAPIRSISASCVPNGLLVNDARQ
jgi:hypothetical protein